MLEGKDVIGCAATGTGKTAAFVLPLVERLAGKQGIRALVLAGDWSWQRRLTILLAVLHAGECAPRSSSAG